MWVWEEFVGGIWRIECTLAESCWKFQGLRRFQGVSWGSQEPAETLCICKCRSWEECGRGLWQIECTLAESWWKLLKVQPNCQPLMKSHLDGCLPWFDALSQLSGRGREKMVNVSFTISPPGWTVSRHFLISTSVDFVSKPSVVLHHPGIGLLVQPKACFTPSKNTLMLSFYKSPQRSENGLNASWNTKALCVNVSLHSSALFQLPHHTGDDSPGSPHFGQWSSTIMHWPVQHSFYFHGEVSLDEHPWSFVLNSKNVDHTCGLQWRPVEFFLPHLNVQQQRPWSMHWTWHGNSILKPAC